MKCWICGVEPLEVYETTALGSAQPTFIPGRWPEGDHVHAERPPTPAELEAAGDRALRVIHEQFM